MKTLSTLTPTLALFLPSCCIILNKPVQHLLVVTDSPCKVEVSGDTASYGKPLNNNVRYITPWPRKVTEDSTRFEQGFIVRRNSKPVSITVSNDSVYKTVIVRQQLSETFWLNFLNPTGVAGFAADAFSQKKFKYPKVVFIGTQKNDSGYLNYRPVVKQQKRRNILKFTPLKSIDLSNPAIELSYERVFGQNTGMQIMVSQLTSLMRPNTRGFRLGFEERFYLKPTAPAGPYVAFEFNYLNTRFQTVTEFGKYQRDTNAYRDSVRVFKRTYNYNLKLGFQTVYRHFCIDAYIGIGVRLKNTILYDKINPGNVMITPFEPGFEYMSTLEGRYYTMSFPLNVRVGWLF